MRKILLEYLKIQYPNGKIFQEKVIGSAVCDVLLVTDRLIGFEIKSDADNYDRLPRQIKAYDRYFDENYLVIGVSHKKSYRETPR